MKISGKFATLPTRRPFTLLRGAFGLDWVREQETKSESNNS